MNVVVVIAVVLLPVWLYGLAWALAACRERLGYRRLPTARSVSRAMRRALQRESSSRTSRVD